MRAVGMLLIAATAACSAAAAGPDPAEELLEAALILRGRYDAALETGDPVRIQAEAGALTVLAAPHFEAFASAMKDPDLSKREAAAFALGFSRNRAAAVLLSEASEDPVPSLRAHAIAGLGLLGLRDLPAKPFLRKLRDEVAGVRLAALFGLRHLPAVPAEAMDAVSAALSDPEPDVRNEALLVLAKAASPASVDAVTPSLRHPRALIRRNAARTLGAIGRPAEKASPELVERLRDPDGSVAEAAASALAAIHGRDRLESYETWRERLEKESKRR